MVMHGGGPVIADPRYGSCDVDAHKLVSGHLGSYTDIRENCLLQFQVNWCIELSRQGKTTRYLLYRSVCRLCRLRWVILARSGRAGRPLHGLVQLARDQPSNVIGAIELGLANPHRREIAALLPATEGAGRPTKDLFHVRGGQQF
jgi:hypothetical protein